MNDLRFALRQLRRSPAFTAVVLLTLALGIGANSALFSVVYAVLIKPLPYREPGRLVQVQSSVAVPGQPVQTFAHWSFPRFEVLRDQNRLFAQVAACASSELTVTGDREAERIQAEEVSSSYFPLLGLWPSLGRAFGTEEDRAAASAPVALIGDGLWRRRFGGDSNVIGKTLRANQVSLTIVGVLPPGFKGQSGLAELWVPISMVPVLHQDPTRLERPWVMWHQTLARLSPGLSLAEAQQGLAELERQIESAYPAPAQTGEATWRIQFVPLQTARTDPAIRRSLWVLLAAVGFVLLITCVNVAHLLLARAVSREGEMAIRLALGATRGHLVRYLLLENRVLATIAGALALLLARWGTDLLAAFQPADSISLFSTHARLPDFGAIQLDAPVLAEVEATDPLTFAGVALVLALAAFLASYLPARRAAKVDPVVALKTE